MRELHVFLGFTIDEWAGIAAIIGSTITAVYRFIVKPLLNKFDILSDSINELTKSSKIEHQSIWKRLNNQTKQIDRHDVEIGVIYQRSGLRREELHDED